MATHPNSGLEHVLETDARARAGEIDRLEIHEVAAELRIGPRVPQLEGREQAPVQMPLHAAEGVHGGRIRVSPPASARHWRIGAVRPFEVWGRSARDGTRHAVDAT